MKRNAIRKICALGVVAILSVALLSCQIESNAHQIATDESWDEFQLKLEDLGFYAHIAPAILDKVKADQRKEGRLFTKLIEDGTGRQYRADPESLSEGGVVDFLVQILPFLESQGAHIADIHQDFSVTEKNYTVSVNGRAYVIFSESDFQHNDTIWMLSVIRTATLVQSLLDDTNATEKIYILEDGFGGQDNHIVFLTPELLDAIKTSSLLIPEEKAYITLAEGMQWLSNFK